MDRASLMQAKFNSELDVHQRIQMQNADCCGHNGNNDPLEDSRMCCGGHNNVPFNDLGQSMCTMNRISHKTSRQPFSQCRVNHNNNSNALDGYYSEGQPMRRKPRSSVSQHLESGYMSESQQSMRRTSTRTSSFRDNGYYSEGQPMRRPKLQVLQEEESGYFNEANTIPESCYTQQQEHLQHHHPMAPSSSRVQAMNISKSKRHSVGVTASMPQDGYCSEGQPRNMKRGSRQISHAMEDGYYSEGQAMRMRPRPNGGSVCNGSNNSIVSHQRERYMERLYPQGMASQDMYQEHHEHEQTCPMHVRHQHKNLQLEEHLHQEDTSTKRDKVSAWLSNIPHPKEMHHDPSVPNPFPELSEDNSDNQRPKPVGCTGKRSTSSKEQGLDPIYEEPEITSISMLLDKRRQLKQLEPIQEEAGNINKENAKPQPIKKGSGGAVSLFGLCGGIASKKKKKDKAIKL